MFTRSHSAVFVSLEAFSFISFKHNFKLRNSTEADFCCFSYSEVTYEVKPLMWIKSMAILIWAFYELPIVIIVTFQKRKKNTPLED